MTIGKAIERLIDNYRLAEGNEFVDDKVAWALYLTWKEADMDYQSKRYTKGKDGEDGEIQTDLPHPCKACPVVEQCSAEDWRTCQWDYVAERSR